MEWLNQSVSKCYQAELAPQDSAAGSARTSLLALLKQRQDRPISNLSNSLADAVAYCCVLISVLSNKDERDKLNDFSALSPAQRMALIVQASTFYGIDGGMTAQVLLESASNGDESPHLLFCCRLFQLYTRASIPRRAVRPLPEAEVEGLQVRLQQCADAYKNVRRWETLSIIVANYGQQYAAKKLRGENVTGEDAAREQYVNVSAEIMRDLLLPITIFPQDFGAEQKEDAVHHMTSEIRTVLLAHYGAIRDSQLVYAATAATDTQRGDHVDANGWAKFLSDIKVVPKVVSKTAAEAVFRSCAVNESPDGNAVISIDPKQWCLAIVKLFFASHESGAAPMEDVISHFQKFLDGIVSALPRCFYESFVAAFRDSGVQDVLRQYKDQIRKIYQEIARDKEHNRVRIEGFTHFVCKDLHMLDASEVEVLFGAIRVLIASGDLADDSVSGPRATPQVQPLGQQPLPGIGMTGFHASLFALARTKCGNPFWAYAAALQAFLCASLFPAFQIRLRLKW